MEFLAEGPRVAESSASAKVPFSRIPDRASLQCSFVIVAVAVVYDCLPFRVVVLSPPGLVW